MSEKLAVLIPAFNAAPSIAEVIRGSAAQLPVVVVVDDGSTDGTCDVARAAGGIVIRHEGNRGKGAALKTGFKWALEQGLDGVVTLDADGQHLPAEIPKILRCHAETGAALVIGGRAHLFEQMLPRRRRANRFSARAIAWAAHVSLTDSQSGFRYYSAELLRAVTLKGDGFDLESEVIIRAGALGLRMENTPISLGFVDGLCTSHYRPIADTVRIAWTVFRTRYLG